MLIDRDHGRFQVIIIRIGIVLLCAGCTGEPLNGNAPNGIRFLQDGELSSDPEKNQLPTIFVSGGAKDDLPAIKAIDEACQKTKGSVCVKIVGGEMTSRLSESIANCCCLERLDLFMVDFEEDAFGLPLKSSVIRMICVVMSNFDDILFQRMGIPASVRCLELASPNLTLASARLIGNQGNIETLRVFQADIDDEAVQQYVRCNRIKELYLRSGRLTDKSVEYISTLQMCRKLTLNAPEISDNAVNYLLSMPALCELNVASTNISKNGIARLRSKIDFVIAD